VIPRLLDALDDPFLINRQFAVRSLHEAFGIRAADSGYQFYMTAKERRESLAELREKFAPGTMPIAPPRPRRRPADAPGGDVR
jgi:hypothetical protein